ncbi:MAG TPA: M48 family metallopeptidase, partial [Rubrobacter sp.]|nr:M48 family metallopeptidase [Rubrobacter sp.]
RLHLNNARLRNPYEIPLYIFSVLVNLLIIALILAGALLLGYVNALVDEPLSGPMVNVIVAAFVALLLLVPGLVLYRQLTRAGIRGSAVRLSRRQFPDIYAVKDDFARRLELQRDPEIYLMSGNGALNAFAASTLGYDFVVIHSELFSNTYEKNKDALAFIIGHELGHLRLGHTRLWYQLSTAYVDRVPLLGDFLSRAREYSCDRHGAYVAPQGEEGLVLLAAGRYVYKQVDVEQLLEQAQRFRGFWPTVAQLPQSHPFTVRRIRVLHDAGFFEAPTETPSTEGVVTAKS